MAALSPLDEDRLPKQRNVLADFAEKLLEAERARAFQIRDPSSVCEGGREVSRAGITEVAVCSVHVQPAVAKSQIL